MNNHRLYRKSKRVVGKGFFTDLLTEAKPILVEKAKSFVREKLNEILSKKKTGAGLKTFYPK